MEAVDALEVAQRAEGKIDTHERICAERYERILENQADGKKDRELLWVALKDGFTEIRAIITKAAMGLIAALFGVVMLLAKLRGVL